MKNDIDPRPEHETTSKQEVTEATPSDNRRFMRVRTNIRAGASMECPVGEC